MGPLVPIAITLSILSYASAKIHGGPRGRFDNQQPRKAAVHHVSAHHTHYSYHPPSHINFMCRHCASMAAYPVYHGLPPSYVYKYRESGSRFADLLTGLALYNLGRATETWHHSNYYTQLPGEKCCLQVIDRTQFEETAFPCFMMSSFLEHQNKQTTDTQNTYDITKSQINIRPYLQSTGSPVEVSRDKDCVVWHNITVHQERTHIPCALLKEYANTMKPSGVPVYVWLPITLGIVLIISISCQCCCKKRKVYKEEIPLNQTFACDDGYCLNRRDVRHNVLITT